MAQNDPPFHREIRSFVVRGGRLTPAQQQAMDELWPRYGLQVDAGELDAEKVFGRQAELVFEIGFGMGGSLVEMAEASPQRDFIGVDVHPPGIGTILRDIHARQLSNLKVYQNDALEVLRKCIRDQSVDCFQIFFPDPWHKKRHHKRRIIQPDFVQLLRQKMKPGGRLHVATDWQNYAEHIMAVMDSAEGFRNSFGKAAFATEHERPQTKFERRGQRLGHGVWDMIFERVS